MATVTIDADDARIIIGLLNALTATYQIPDDDDVHHEILRELGGDLVHLIDQRVDPAGASIPHLDQRADFVHEARMLAMELVGDLNDRLNTV